MSEPPVVTGSLLAKAEDAYAQGQTLLHRVSELEAALTGVLGRFTKSDAGYRARISGTVLARLQAVADGTKDGGADGH